MYCGKSCAGSGLLFYPRCGHLMMIARRLMNGGGRSLLAVRDSVVAGVGAGQMSLGEVSLRACQSSTSIPLLAM